MAIDTRQKRMSALMFGMPFRGPLVDATDAGFTQGNRAAACWMYAGIAIGPVVAAVLGLYPQWQVVTVGDNSASM